MNDRVKNDRIELTIDVIASEMGMNRMRVLNNRLEGRLVIFGL